MSQNLNLNNVIFHSLAPFGEYERNFNSIQKLEAILKSGYILSRQFQIIENNGNESMKANLEKYLDEKYSYNWNGMAHISVCKKNSNYNENSNSQAYEEYVKGNAGIGIILSPNVIELVDRERTTLMDGEFQIKDKIPLEYMIGIFCGGKSITELENEVEEAENSGISRKDIKQTLPYSIINNQIENYQEIKNILCSYGYENTPIFSSRDGNEIGDVKDFIENFSESSLCE